MGYPWRERGMNMSTVDKSEGHNIRHGVSECLTKTQPFRSFTMTRTS
jgi:hypothetical protein